MIPEEPGAVRTERRATNQDRWDVHDVSNEEKPGCLGYIEGYTAQLYGDHINKPLLLRFCHELGSRDLHPLASHHSLFSGVFLMRFPG